MSQKFTGRHQLIDRLASQVGDRELAVHLLQKRGQLAADGKTLTAKGAERDAMTAEERAIDRAARASSNPKAAFRYDEATNRATLKPGFGKKSRISAAVIKKTWRSR